MGDHTASTQEHREEVKQDAKNRGLRTLLQGAIAAVLVSVAGVVLEMVVPGTVIDWPAVGMAAAVAPVSGLGSYFQRRLEK